MWFTVCWPGMEPQWALDTIQLFGERVIPEIKRATPVCPVPQMIHTAVTRRYLLRSAAGGKQLI